MTTIALQTAVIVLLTLLNGFFAMSETALVSSRKARLRQRAEEGDRGAGVALEMADSPNRWQTRCASCPCWRPTPGP
jgi:putative hemolysin